MMRETNNYYGGKIQYGTNILWVNGGVDPWSAMGLVESDTQDVFYIPVR